MLVRTRFLPATSTMGDRIKVTANGHQRTYPFNGQVSDPHMHATSRFLSDVGYCAIGQIYHKRGMNTGNIYEVRDYTQTQLSDVLHDAQSNGQEILTLKVQGLNKDSKWLNITTDQLARIISVL